MNVAPRRFLTLGLLTAFVACQHDTVAPGDTPNDTPVVVETHAGAQAIVTQEPDTVDGLVTYVVTVRANGGAISSFQGAVSFAPGSFTLVSKNTPSNHDGDLFLVNAGAVESGHINFAAFTTTSFTAAGAGMEALRFTVRPLRNDGTITASLDVVGSEQGSDLRASPLGKTPAPHISSCGVVTPLWGDANDDNAVNVIDAQQIARITAGLNVGNPDALSDRGDVNGDGHVDIIDAQQIGRYAIALSASPRAGSSMPPRVMSLWVSPGMPTVEPGASVQLFATPRDGDFVNLVGCVTVTYSSSDPSAATVDANGLVTGIAEGTSTITVTAGQQTVEITVNVLWAAAPM